MFRKDRYPEPRVQRGENTCRACALKHDRPRPPGPIELLQSELPPSAVRRRRFRVELHRASGRPDAPLAAERHAVAFSDLATDDRDIELAVVQQCRDVGTYAELACCRTAG
jgi:hypothetical protein